MAPVFLCNNALLLSLRPCFLKNAVAIPPVFLRVFLKNTYSLRKIARYIQ